MTRTGTPLRIAAALEAVSLAILLINLAAGNNRSVAALVGPLHGCLYLLVIIATARDPRTTRGTTTLAVVPGVGGLLARRRLARGGVG